MPADQKIEIAFLLYGTRVGMLIVKVKIEVCLLEELCCLSVEATRLDVVQGIQEAEVERFCGESPRKFQRAPTYLALR